MKATARQVRASELRNRDERKLRNRERYHSLSPEKLTEKLAKKAAWRRANRDKVAAQKRRYVERHKDDPKSAYNRYQVKYRRRFGAHYRELQNMRNAIEREDWKPPRCQKCGKPTRWTPLPGAGRPWLTCNRCVPSCIAKLRLKNRARRRRVLAKAIPPKPVKVRHPERAAVRGPGYERLCITAGCETVLTRRKKKCTRCKERDAQLARQLVGMGRGRRTDLHVEAAA